MRTPISSPGGYPLMWLRHKHCRQDCPPLSHHAIDPAAYEDLLYLNSSVGLHRIVSTNRAATPCANCDESDMKRLKKRLRDFDPRLGGRQCVALFC
jgi:hypothetical protein